MNPNNALRHVFLPSSLLLEQLQRIHAGCVRLNAPDFWNQNYVEHVVLASCVEYAWNRIEVMLERAKIVLGESFDSTIQELHILDHYHRYYNQVDSEPEVSSSCEGLMDLGRYLIGQEIEGKSDFHSVDQVIIGKVGNTQIRGFRRLDFSTLNWSVELWLPEHRILMWNSMVTRLIGMSGEDEEDEEGLVELEEEYFERGQEDCFFLFQQPNLETSEARKTDILVLVSTRSDERFARQRILQAVELINFYAANPEDPNTSENVASMTSRCAKIVEEFGRYDLLTWLESAKFPLSPIAMETLIELLGLTSDEIQTVREGIIERELSADDTAPIRFEMESSFGYCTYFADREYEETWWRVLNTEEKPKIRAIFASSTSADKKRLEYLSEQMFLVAACLDGNDALWENIRQEGVAYTAKLKESKKRS